jgi:hypothetical protein
VTPAADRTTLPGVDAQAIRRAALVTLRRAICERFPPGAERRTQLRWLTEAVAARQSGVRPQTKTPPEGGASLRMLDRPQRATVRRESPEPTTARPKRASVAGSGTPVVSLVQCAASRHPVVSAVRFCGQPSERLPHQLTDYPSTPNSQVPRRQRPPIPKTLPHKWHRARIQGVGTAMKAACSSETQAGHRQCLQVTSQGIGSITSPACRIKSGVKR